MYKFEEIRIGQIEEISHTITEKDLESFTNLTGDTNPLHINQEYASRTHFKKRVVHGMLSASFISTLIGTKLPGEGALWYSQSIQFLQPVWIGDNIRIRGEVKQKSESQRSLIIDINVFNQSDQLVIKGESNVQIPIVEDEIEEKKIVDGFYIVIGGTGGIGKAVVKKLISENKNVVFTFNKSEKEADILLEENKGKNSKIYKYQLNLYSEVEIQKFIQWNLHKFQQISALINCTTDSINNIGFGELKWETISRQLDIHLKAVFYLAKSILPHFVSNKYGKIINISTVYIDEKPPVKLYDYTIAKSALRALTKSLAVEYGPMGININLVSPSMTETSLIATIPQKTKLLTTMQTPLRRLAKPEDIANAVAFLMSDDASFITGETLRINGGQLMI